MKTAGSGRVQPRSGVVPVRRGRHADRPARRRRPGRRGDVGAGRDGGARPRSAWICAALSDADRAAARQRRRRPGRDPGARSTSPVRMLDIPPDTFDRAYNNVANSILWFVHHLLFDTPNQPRFGREFRRDWAAYLAYNEAFAAAMADGPGGWRSGVALGRRPRADPGLPPQPGPATAAGQAGRRPRATSGIAHFSHTPWAPPDYYRMLPARGGRGRARRHARRGPRWLSRRAGGPPRSWTAARRSWARR